MSDDKVRAADIRERDRAHHARSVGVGIERGPHIRRKLDTYAARKSEASDRVKLQFKWDQVRLDPRGRRRLSPSEQLLLLLDVGRISGRTMLQKQVFLAFHQVFGPRLASDPGFRPDRFGPFSQIVADLPFALRASGLVNIQSKGEGHSTYVLAPQGRSVARDVRGFDLPESVIALLHEKKASWDEWTTEGALRYVYRNFPRYAVKTVRPDLKWE